MKGVRPGRLRMLTRLLGLALLLPACGADFLWVDTMGKKPELVTTTTSTATTTTSAPAPPPPPPPVKIKPPLPPPPPGQDKRQRGGQPGHPKHERALFPAEQVDQFFEHPLHACPCCGGKLRLNGELARVVQQVDVEPAKLTVQQHTCPEYWCALCGKSCKAVVFQVLICVGWTPYSLASWASVFSSRRAARTTCALNCAE